MGSDGTDAVRPDDASGHPDRPEATGRRAIEARPALPHPDVLSDDEAWLSWGRRRGIRVHDLEDALQEARLRMLSAAKRNALPARLEEQCRWFTTVFQREVWKIQGASRPNRSTLLKHGLFLSSERSTEPWHRLAVLDAFQQVAPAEASASALFFSLLAGGISAREAARALGMSLRTVQRRRRTLILELKRELSRW